MSKRTFNVEATKEAIKNRIRFNDYAKAAEKSGYVCPCCHSGSPDKIAGSGSGAVTEGVEKNTWYCQKCNEGGDVVDYVSFELGKGKHLKGEDFREVIEECCRRFGIDEVEWDNYALPQAHEEARHAVDNGSDDKTPTEEKDAPQVDYYDYLLKCYEQLENCPDAVDYLKKRGISLETAKKFGIGFDPKADPACNPGKFVDNERSKARIIIPTSRYHYVGRRIDGVKEFAKLNPKGSKCSIFGSTLLSAMNNENTCFVVEGAFDAMAIYETVNQPAVALNSYNNGRLLLEKIQELGLKDRNFIVVPDDDEDEEKRKAVHEAASELVKAIRKTGNRATVCDVCAFGTDTVKDANDFLIIDPETFYTALENAIYSHTNYYANITPESLSSSVCEPTEEELAKEDEILKLFGDYDDEEFDGFLERCEGDTYTALSTDVKWLDDILGGGILPGSLMVLLAPPAVGKTALCQYIADKYADKHLPVKYLNFEMSSDLLLARALSMRMISYTPPQDVAPVNILRMKNLHQSERDEIKAVIKDYKKNVRPYLKFLGCRGMSKVVDLEQYTNVIGNRALRHNRPAPILVVDYLQILGGGKNEDRMETIRQTMMMLKNYATTYKTFVVVISATNRDSAKSGQITMESGRDSSNVEFSADYLLGLNYWEIDVGTIDSQAMGKISAMKKREPFRRLVLRVIKSRMAVGDEDQVKLYFDGKHSAFYEESELFNQEEGYTPLFQSLKKLNPNLKLYQFEEEKQDDYEPREQVRHSGISK